jgi:hypothetical protein
MAWAKALRSPFRRSAQKKKARQQDRAFLRIQERPNSFSPVAVSISPPKGALGEVIGGPGGLSAMPYLMGVEIGSGGISAV